MAEVGPPEAVIGRADLGLVDAPAPQRHVEVAVDAAGVAGTRTWTYVVPDDLADVAAGEPVLVEWGRRRAVGIVLGDAPAPEGVTARPIGARVRSDGPLLPPLALALSREITTHYLAPPALAIRAMLPPGLLEKLELVATPLDRPPSAPPPAGTKCQLATQPCPLAMPRPRSCSTPSPEDHGRSGTLPRPTAVRRSCGACGPSRTTVACTSNGR
jgi:primosomal protein N'